MPVCLSTVSCGQAELKRGPVDQNRASWNPFGVWLRRLAGLQDAA
jgi:hypothetical protein